MVAQLLGKCNIIFWHQTLLFSSCRVVWPRHIFNIATVASFSPDGLPVVYSYMVAWDIQHPSLAKCDEMKQRRKLSWLCYPWHLCWLVVWNIFYFSHHIGNFMIPTDEVIFFRGVGIPPTRYGFYMDSMWYYGFLLIYWLDAGVSQRSWSVSFAKFNPTMGHGFGKYPILTTDIRKKSRAFGYDPRHPTVADLLGSWFLRKGPKQSLLVK